MINDYFSDIRLLII